MTADQIDDEQDPSQDETASEGEGNADPATVTIPVAELDALSRDVAQWKERCARGQADFDNARKRLRKEADEAGTRAIARFVKPILNEMDNLDRAISSAKPEAFAELAMGVSLIRDNLATALKNAGLEIVSTDGAFDPSVHEAIAEMATDEVPKGHVAQVHRAGYRLKDQLVRSAQVVVAKPTDA